MTVSKREAKSAAMRLRLLDATFDCLVERGYHGTSTVAVCERAGVARGTMLHHFPNRKSLTLAALEHVLMRRAERFHAELAGVEFVDEETLVRQLWRAVKGPTYLAWLELLVASRTDPELEGEFRAVMGRFDAMVTAIATEIMPPEFARGEDISLAVSVVFTALNGLALDLLQNDEERVEATADLLVRWMGRLPRS